MKLRVNGNSLKFRITRIEVRTLHEAGRIGETARFIADQDDGVLYVIEHANVADAAFLTYETREISIRLPTAQLEEWIRSDEKLFYASIDLGTRGPIDLFLEKDYELLETCP
jgi:hypothetical protein